MNAQQQQRQQHEMENAYQKEWERLFGQQNLKGFFSVSILYFTKSTHTHKQCASVCVCTQFTTPSLSFVFMIWNYVLRTKNNKEGIPFLLLPTTLQRIKKNKIVLRQDPD